ncbi:MAG TPA: YggS family pyridoxal phosphate-dependent enzyme [Anaerolineales bacterium]|nr:YggS family pyridoxal phosphate-dependent enzyme [Anaerolineales bacterium]
MADGIAARYQEVIERIADAARVSGRPPEAVKLVVVTKGHAAVRIGELIELGVRDFGENRVDEALLKQQIMKDQGELNWHMIGHVQSRKASEVSGKFALVHSLDRVKLANRLNQRAEALERVQPVLLQFNVSGEGTKSGWQAASPESWPGLIPDIEAVLKCTHLDVRGLMTMAPYSTNSEDARPYFARLRQLRDYFQERFPETDWHELSMGMSGDFETGIQEGATLVRIGTAIVGAR